MSKAFLVSCRGMTTKPFDEASALQPQLKVAASASLVPCPCNTWKTGCESTCCRFLTFTSLEVISFKSFLCHFLATGVSAVGEPSSFQVVAAGAAIA